MHKKNIKENIVGERLKKAREYLGYKKQGYFAEKLEIVQNTYSNYENGHREIPFKILEKISQNGINLNWLLTGEGEMYQTQSPQKTNNEVPTIHGISADEREAIRIIRENPELFKLNQAYAKHKKKGKDAIESFVDGLQINLSLQNSV